MNPVADPDVRADRPEEVPTGETVRQAPQMPPNADNEVQENAGEGPGKNVDLLEMMIQMEERKQHLKLLEELLGNPAILSLKNDAIPCSSSPEEIEQRRVELQYRADILKVLLEVTQSELEMLRQAVTEQV